MFLSGCVSKFIAGRLNRKEDRDGNKMGNNRQGEGEWGGRYGAGYWNLSHFTLSLRHVNLDGQECKTTSQTVLYCQTVRLNYKCFSNLQS